MSNPVHVAVAVIRNDDGKIFITRRPDHVHQGGLWEFPGGKVENDESVQDALRREIQEEVGIQIQHALPLITIPFRYPDKHVLLDVWEVLSYSGVPHGKEGQASNWVDVSDLQSISFPPANHSIVRALQLPASILVTPEPDDNFDLFLESLTLSIDNTQHWIQLRARNLSTQRYYDLAREASEVCRKLDARLMLGSDADSVQMLDAAGLHLTARQLMNISERPVSSDKWLSASCHSQPEIEKANAVGVDFIYLGSVKKTASHEGGEVLGWKKFSELVSSATMPVYAIGGMTKDDVDQCRLYGGQGIAAISSLWKSK